jgi:hypothetical protein
MDDKFRDDEHGEGDQKARLRFDVGKNEDLHGSVKCAGLGQARINSGAAIPMHLRRCGWLPNSWKTHYANLPRLRANKVAAEPGQRRNGVRM